MTQETSKRDAIQGEIIHEYDGIEEADNKLPQWWLWTFYIAIAFSLVYWVYYEAVGVGHGPLDSFTAERMEAMDTGAPITDTVLLELASDKLAVRAGEKAFAQNCAKCHGSRAEGNIGPNLTDEFWIGEGSPVAIYSTIAQGRTSKGMPAWGMQLGPGACKQIASYLLTVRNTNLPGKPAQGQKWQETASAESAALQPPSSPPGNTPTER